MSANAGTGKTEVLVRRVLRLLLAGSQPESILCLTYTKTAAAAMQNRLLKELADWATTAAGRSAREAWRLLLAALPGRNGAPARRLFAQALEAKGGLKIYTIHGFCERLFQRFPARGARHAAFRGARRAATRRSMRRAAFDAAIARAAENSDSALGQALARIIAVTSEDYFRKVVDAVLAKRAELARMMAHHDSRPDWAEAEAAALKHLLDVAGDTEHALLVELAGVLTDEEIDDAIAAFATFVSAAKTDRDTESFLREARASDGERRVAALGEIFLTGPGEARDKFCKKGFADAEPSVVRTLTRAQARFAGLDLRLAHLRMAEVSGALLILADAIQSDYERRKRAEAVLDYDDLIIKTARLAA